MNGSSNGGTATAALFNSSTRTPRRPAPAPNTNNNTGDESDRSRASSSNNANAQIANGSSTNSSGATVSVNTNTNKPSNTAALASSLDHRGNNIQELKKSLTLDFTNPESAKKSLQTQTPEILSFLRLTSPELEKFLTQGFAQGVSVVQTPTPTQYFFPKNVTNEQEQYARGFLDALNQIYQRSGFIPVNNILSPGFVANTVAQEAKEGGNKDHTGSTSTSAASVFPGPSTSSVSFNAALVSNFLAAISTPTLPSIAVPEPALVTTVSTSGAQQFRQTLAAAAAAAASSSIAPQHSFYAINPRPVAFPTSTSTAANQLLSNFAAAASTNTSITLKREPDDDRCTPSPTPYESRSTSVGSSSYRDHSNFGSGSDAAAAAALAAMNRNGYANFQSVAGSSFMPTNTQQHFMALTNAAAEILMSQQHQPDHNLSSTASASSMASSTSDGDSMKMEMDDNSLHGHLLPGTLPLEPAQQERLKLERKRARNRQAATKCRKRKIERISHLESEVALLEDQNGKLSERRNILMDELQELRKLLNEHKLANCNIVVPSQSSSSTASSSTSSLFTGNLLNGTK